MARLDDRLNGTAATHVDRKNAHHRRSPRAVSFKLRSFIFAGLLACLGVAPLSPAEAARCTLNDVEHCSSVNDLLFDNTFKKALQQFLGSARVDYFKPGSSLGEQAWFGLNGPPDDRVELPNGLYLFAACPLHNCGGQAVAVILDGQGRIAGVGFSHFHCTRQCEDKRSLDLYVRRGDAADSVGDALAHWGRDAIQTLSPEADSGLAGRTVTHVVH